MKAKEYFNQFQNENQDKTADWRLFSALRQMVLEVQEIAALRNAKSDAALLAIFKEMEIKSHSFIRLVNEIEPFKTEGVVKLDAFKLFVKSTCIKLYDTIWKEIN